MNSDLIQNSSGIFNPWYEILGVNWVQVVLVALIVSLVLATVCEQIRNRKGVGR